MAELTEHTNYIGAAPPAFLPPGMEPGSQAQEGTSAILVQAPRSAFRRYFSFMLWSYVFVTCLLFFTLIKLPQDRLKALIQGNISSALATKGIMLSADQSEINFLSGFTYSMQNVTVTFPAPEATGHIDKIEVGPSFSSLLSGKLGINLNIQNGSGNLHLVGGIRGSKASISFNANKLDLGKTGLFRLLANMNGSATITGTGNFTTNTDAINESNGETQLDFEKINLDQQVIQGFTLPKLSDSQGHLEFEMNQGRGVLKALKLGKSQSTTDDLIATVSGDINLAKSINLSTVNLNAKFSISQNILKSFSLLEAILGSAKQPDGSFAYHLTGPLMAPNPMPAGPNGT